jgi:hypothetical protein
MALKVEGVMDGGVHAKKPLGRSSRLEPLHFVLSSSHQLVRIFGAIVLPQSLLMRAGQSQTIPYQRLRQFREASSVTLGQPGLDPRPSAWRRYDGVQPCAAALTR